MGFGKPSLHSCDRFGLLPKWQTRDTTGLLSVLDRAFVLCCSFPVLLQCWFSNKEFAMLVWAIRTALWSRKWRLHWEGRRNVRMHLRVVISVSKSQKYCPTLRPPSPRFTVITHFRFYFFLHNLHWSGVGCCLYNQMSHEATIKLLHFFLYSKQSFIQSVPELMAPLLKSGKKKKKILEKCLCVKWTKMNTNCHWSKLNLKRN